MTFLDEQIQGLHEKALLLLKKYNNLYKENQRLLRDKENLTIQLTAKNEQVNQLQRKLDAIKISPVAMSEEVKKDLEKRISVYIKEIDNCLSLLNS